MIIKFKSEEAMNRFVESTPYTDPHNLMLAGLVGLGEFSVHHKHGCRGHDGYWIVISGTDFYISSYEMYLFEIVGE
ncbi:hypothetical protein HPMBJEAJ_00382 [Aeromonas phage avDM6]|nr:hypothetical protein HPMBJEAJ_00382 [Aeromonas phage avDM6]